MGEPSTKRGLWSRRTLFGATLGAALVFMILGVIFWGGFNTAMEATNNMEFCISCHEMEENVYQEYRGTVHDANRSGVRAGCPDCHVPRPWIHKVVRKIQASNEIYHKIMGTVSTPEKFAANRLTMAKRVWAAMKKTDSRECRNCHDITAMNPVNQKPRARQQHLNAMERGQTCIDCHKGIAHKPVHTQLTDAELEALEKPNPDFIRPIPTSYTAGLERVEAAEAEAKAKAQEARQREREAQAAMKAEQEARMAAAVAAAIEAYKAGQAGAAVAAPAAAAAADGGFGIDWSDVPGREVVLFYPGQSSMEWILNGRDHSGKRAFEAGDRCFDCHDKEAADIGRKIVTGEKLEPQPIEGKRGSIPVTVQAAHDAENLYLRFQWEDTPHVPVPFVEGGKMDPENPVKLALMLATDEVEYADRAGCWGTCHHDLRSMPDEASPEATKYLTESRTEIEIRGRGDKPRGGWDKRKGEAEMAAELEAGHFMDLLRFKSGAGAAEDGHVLADRVMEGGQGTAMSGRLENGVWTVTVKRKLATGAPGDVALEPGRLYNIGFAIHDDYSAARWHHVSVGYKLGFDNPDAEINAVQREARAMAAPAPVAAAAPATAAPAAVGGDVAAGVDWSKAGEREVVLFYPGQSSMEWILNGRDHSGKRAFEAGDRCFDCHDKEAADIGRKIVTGEKLEPQPIEGKRGSIPVTVQAAHDAENLYLRFQWEDTPHVPVPFVEGGKMDPENPVKLALMLATDEVEYADRAGCWGTCHHDLRSMPDEASPEATKYLTESRTEIEIRGRGDKPRGGWDKRKGEAEMAAELEAGHFMDLLRFKSGAGAAEDGHVLADRVMEGGQGTAMSGRLENGVWTVTVKRKLATGAPGDVALEPGRLYNIGFAIHDDYSAARWHHVSVGYKLGLDNPDAEINVTAQ